MKSSFVALFAAAVLPFGLAACGGAELAETDGYDLAKGNAGDEPLAFNPAALKVATTVVGHPYLVDVEGTGTSSGMHWTLTYWGDIKGWATVKISSTGAATLVAHGHMIDSQMPASNIQLDKVKVTVAQLATIAAKAGLTGKCTHLELTQVVGSNPNPHWAVEYGKKQILIDATTGNQE